MQNLSCVLHFATDCFFYSEICKNIKSLAFIHNRVWHFWALRAIFAQEESLDFISFWRTQLFFQADLCGSVTYVCEVSDQFYLSFF